MNQKEIQERRNRIDKIGLRYQCIVTVVMIISMLGPGMWLEQSPPMAIVLGFVIFVVSTVAFNRIINWEIVEYAQLEKKEKL